MPTFQDFLALHDVDRFVAEFSMYLQKPDNIVFMEMPHVDEATDRRKRFRYAFTVQTSMPKSVNV